MSALSLADLLVGDLAGQTVEAVCSSCHGIVLTVVGEQVGEASSEDIAKMLLPRCDLVLPDARGAGYKMLLPTLCGSCGAAPDGLLFTLRAGTRRPFWLTITWKKD